MKFNRQTERFVLIPARFSLGLPASALVTFLLLLPAGQATAAPTVLVDQGKANLPIVISDSASEETQALAKELAGYLEQISKAPFEVKTEQQGAAIFLGTKEEFPQPEFAEALAVDKKKNGAEAFVIVPKDDSLYLIGATEKGSSHAAFRFLERLGCRWFFPAKEWEIIPERVKIVADFTETSRPQIPARRIWWGYGYFDRQEGRCQADYEAWARHNRMAESFRTYTGHAWQAIIAANKATFDEHPEYLALVKGERRGPQFCVSNPTVRKLALNWALEKLEKIPELDMVSMETSDGANHCECDDCKKLGNISDRAFGLANEVARVVAKKFPGKMVGMLAYGDHSEPPSFELEDNVYVQSTAGFVRGKYTFDELMKLWPEKTANIGFYEYFSVWLWDFDQLPGGKGNDIAAITERIRQYADIGATSITCESGNNWGLHGRGYYVANRLMWNPEENPDELLADFYQKSFGPAADVMKRFYQRFSRENDPLMSEHLLALGFRDIQEASKLTANRSDIQGRLNHLKQYLHYVRVKWDIDHLAKDDPRRKSLTLDGLTWCYRTRYSYMNHWAGMWQGWTRKAAEEFEQPEWSYRYRESPNPWANEEPVTVEETERVFQADLKRFQPQDIDERTFSEDLVWAGLADLDAKIAKPRPLSHRYQRKMRYAMISKKGEPLVFTITTGVIKHYRDRADGRWTVTTPTGTEIGSERLPQDGEKHRVKIAVSKAGHYWIEYDDRGAGWGIETEPGIPISLALKRGTRIIHLGQFRDPIFFFVPKETRRLQFFWEGGSLKPQLYGPDGTMIAEISANGSFVTVDVPKGSDGKPWFFKRFAPMRFWLVNAPNYLAAAPSELILPKEVVEK